MSLRLIRLYLSYLWLVILSICLCISLFILFILLIGSNSTLLAKLILLLSLKLKLQDLKSIHYFFGIEVKPISMRLILTQHKHALDILYRAYMFSCKPIDTSVSPFSSKLAMLSSGLYSGSTRYKQIVGVF